MVYSVMMYKSCAIGMFAEHLCCNLFIFDLVSSLDSLLSFFPVYFPLLDFIWNIFVSFMKNYNFAFHLLSHKTVFWNDFAIQKETFSLFLGGGACRIFMILSRCTTYNFMNFLERGLARASGAREHAYWSKSSRSKPLSGH